MYIKYLILKTNKAFKSHFPVLNLVVVLITQLFHNVRLLYGIFYLMIPTVLFYLSTLHIYILNIYNYYE